MLSGWYAAWGALATGVAFLLTQPESRLWVGRFLPLALFFVFLYWQLAPLVLASQGASLDLRRLLPFPISTGRLFAMETALRLSACGEIVLVTAGAAAGLGFYRPAVAYKPVGSLALFAIFNLLVGVGLRRQMERWLARRRLRELVVLLAVLAAALPQLLLAVGAPAQLQSAVDWLQAPWWPWSAAGRLAAGGGSGIQWLALFFWTALAGGYGWWQFTCSLQLSAPAARVESSMRSPFKLSSVGQLLSGRLKDPFGALVEKEFRSYLRSPRFRLLFIMGFSFGILIFLPMLIRGGSAAPYQPALVCAYALLLLGDVLFWNIFGADRSAIQLYFLAPVSLRTVIAAKNLAAAVLVLLEFTGVVAVYSLLRLPAGAGRILEAYLGPGILSLYMFAAGNLTSVVRPVPVSPERTTGSASSALVRILLILLVPLLAAPVVLAYVVRIVSGSRMSFYLMLGMAALGGVLFYWFSLGAAAQKAEKDRERMVGLMQAGPGLLHAS